MNLSISAEVLKEHLKRFSQSLKRFPDFYLPRFFVTSDDLPRHIPYLCPICLENFFLFTENGAYKTVDFDVDHFPPQSVGGKLFVLVCKDCNNKAGTSYDHTLKQKTEFLSFQKGRLGSEMKVVTEISNLTGRFSSKLNVDDEGKLVLGLKPKNKKVPPLDRWLERPKVGNDWRITLTYYEPKPELVKKALIKSAYLYCFNHWGYDFTISYTGEQMRAVLRGEIEYPFPDIAPFWIDDIPNLPEGICLMQIDQWSGYVVNIPLKIQSPSYKIVAVTLIPDPGPQGWQKLSKFKDIVEGWKIFDATFTSLKSEL